MTPWTVAYETPLFMGLSRQEYCRGLPFSSPRDRPNPGIEPVSLALAGGFFTTEPPEKSSFGFYHHSNQLPFVGSSRTNCKFNGQFSNFVTLTSLEGAWPRITVIAKYRADYNRLCSRHFFITF